MKRSKLLVTLLCSASMVAGSVLPTVPAMADAMRVVTLGADLSDEQKNTMMKYFNVTADQVQILTITNADEREHLSAYVPLEQIGSRTVSCAYVKPTKSGGIRVRTANLNWVTGNMIATTLSTSGVKNCEVVAACPFEVSGTGALTGVQMAYEAASGEKLDETKKEIATEEMVVTGNLADEVGQDDATVVINQSKMQVIADDIQNADDIYNVVVNVANDNGVYVSDDQISTIVELLEEIAQQNYDYSDMEETLERVNDNVTGETTLADDEMTEVPEDSIVNDVNDSVLGDDVIQSSTEAVSSTEDQSSTETTLADDSYSDSMSAVVEDTNAEGGAENAGENDAAEGTDSVPETEVSEDSVSVDEMDTDYLSDEAKVLFEKAKKFCDGEYKGDGEALAEAVGEDAYVSVTLDEDMAKKVTDKVLKTYLGILGNGAGSYEPTGEEKYLAPELNMLQAKLKDLFGIDLAEDADRTDENVDILGDGYTQDEKQLVYEDTMSFFEKLYGENTETVVSDEAAQVGDEYTEEYTEDSSDAQDIPEAEEEVYVEDIDE